MNIIAAFVFGLVVLTLLGYLWHTLHELHGARYGRCWTIIIRTMEDMVDDLTDNFRHQIIRDQSIKDLRTLEAFVNAYRGDVDIDKSVEKFDPNCPFFKSLKNHIALNWHFSESPLTSAIDAAIYAYNIDSDYEITPREFISYLGSQFHYHFITKF